MNGTKISDKVSTESLLKKFNIMSVNQLNAQAKLLEVWKSLNNKTFHSFIHSFIHINDMLYAMAYVGRLI